MTRQAARAVAYNEAPNEHAEEVRNLRADSSESGPLVGGSAPKNEKIRLGNFLGNRIFRN